MIHLANIYFQFHTNSLKFKNKMSFFHDLSIVSDKIDLG